MLIRKLGISKLNIQALYSSGTDSSTRKKRRRKNLNIN